MTSVKLKLMLFLLNSLLSADLVHSRPYSDYNTTDIIMNISNNNTFNIPVDSNSDTLIVANEETAEETNKNSNTRMEAIVNAEQDRDEDLSENNYQEQSSVLGVSKNEAEAFEKQLNISSPLLEEMIDSETDREETLTDILFRPDSEFAEAGPRFEFLIAAKINSSDANGTLKDLSLSDNNLDKRDRNISDVFRKVDYVELVEVIKAGSENSSAYHLANITAHNIDNDLAPDTILSMFSGYTDFETLLLACFATLLPLLCILFSVLFIRCLLKRFWPNVTITDTSGSDSSEKRENQQLKSPDDTGEAGTPPANGSIFTMTLKNNHLIVETEERNDITKNGRETKMKYSPDNDGIFVVEVQQSAGYRPIKSHVSSPHHDPQISTNQALIHRVPEELDRKIIMEEDSERSSEKFEKRALALSSTGLSISDLSMSSIGSHNVSYSYGSQMGYDQGPFGYPVYAGYETSKDDLGDAIVHDSSQEPLIGKTPTDPDKPVVTAAIFKQDSIIGSDALQGPGYCIEGSTDGPLLSDVQAREVSLLKLHDQKEKKLENGVAVPMMENMEKPSFSRADSLPSSAQDESKISKMEPIYEDAHKEAWKGKRGSLPTIKTNILESIQAGSKFEKLTNEISPGECSFDAPPMITITEEAEAKSDTTS
ncbi:unnamed protein product [Danaus chrysippus]|uniref:(African queen) hypothetical protein n=1 Tax=Danaus chrysippus TaxID=151541 RepID=A0A8J2VQJ4_9NEOP|nr:unnamed protein product [Danaus chrysippus]